MPRITDWLKHSILSIAVFCIFLAGLYLLAEYLYIFDLQPDQWFGRARAILLTVAAVFGLPIVVWRTAIANRQNQISRESHHAELFRDAVELLGATREGNSGALRPVIETRIGAIFALERLSKVSQADYGIIIETLSAYVREQCGRPTEFNFQGDDPDEVGIDILEKSRRLVEWNRELHEWIAELRTSPVANREDVIVALTVLSRRNEGRHWSAQRSLKETEPDLSRANLQGADLSDYMEGLFSGEDGVSHASVDGAVLEGFKIEQSSLLGLRMQHELTGSKAVPRSLMGVVAWGLTLKNPDHFPVLDGADLSFAHMDDAQCKGSSFRGARMVRAIFKGAELGYAKFGIANASTAEFDGADLTGAEFLNALLEGASFVGANLSDAGFQYAVLHEAQLEGALLVRADFTGARYLNPESIGKAFGTLDTVLPVGMSLPSHWNDEESALREWRRFRHEREMGSGD